MSDGGLPEPQWADDPTGRHESRYWDGSAWTDQVADGGISGTDLFNPPTVEPIDVGSTNASSATARRSTRGVRRRQKNWRRAALIGGAVLALAIFGSAAALATRATDHSVTTSRTQSPNATAPVPASPTPTLASVPTSPPTTAAPAPTSSPPTNPSPASSCPNGSYVNVSGNTVCSPYASPGGAPAGATARCNDGTYSFSQHRQGTCSYHGGVAQWLQ